MLPSNFSIRRIDESEANTLTKIHEICFPHYLNRQAFTDFFSTNNTFAFLVEQGEIPAAMMVYRPVIEQADLLTIAVLPEFQKRGIARHLMEKLITDCHEMKVEKIFLEVEVGNDHAIKLYNELGFKEINRRKLYYQQRDGSLTDGLVMVKKLTSQKH